MNHPTQLSYSALTKWQQCPSLWRAIYIDKIKGPVGEEAHQGNDFDQLVTHRLGLPLIDKFTGAPVPVPEITPELKTMLAAYEKFPGNWMTNTKPEQKPSAQQKILITPEQWKETAARYGSSSTIAYPFLGFPDMTRIMTDGVRTELLDLKTSKRKDWHSTWLPQVVIYGAILDVARVTIHLVYRTTVPKKKGGGYDYQVEPYSLFLHANKPLVKCIFDAAGYRSKEINRCVNENEFEELPRNPGFWCTYCPLQVECPVYNTLKGRA